MPWANSSWVWWQTTSHSLFLGAGRALHSGGGDGQGMPAGTEDYTGKREKEGGGNFGRNSCGRRLKRPGRRKSIPFSLKKRQRAYTYLLHALATLGREGRKEEKEGRAAHACTHIFCALEDDFEEGKEPVWYLALHGGRGEGEHVPCITPYMYLLCVHRRKCLLEGEEKRKHLHCKKHMCLYYYCKRHFSTLGKGRRREGTCMKTL